MCYCKWNGSIFHYLLTYSRQNVCLNNQILILKMSFSLYQMVSVDTSAPVYKPNLRLLILEKVTHTKNNKQKGSCSYFRETTVAHTLHKVTGWSWWRAEQRVLIPTPLFGTKTTWFGFGKDCLVSRGTRSDPPLNLHLHPSRGLLCAFALIIS